MFILDSTIPFSYTPDWQNPIATGMAESNIVKEKKDDKTKFADLVTDALVESDKKEDTQKIQTVQNTQKQKAPQYLATSDTVQTANTLAGIISEGLRPLGERIRDVIKAFQSSADTQLPAKINQSINNGTFKANAAAAGMVAQIVVDQFSKGENKKYAEVSVKLLKVAKDNNGKMKPYDILSLCNKDPEVGKLLLNKKESTKVLAVTSEGINIGMKDCEELIKTNNKKRNKKAEEFIGHLDNAIKVESMLTHGWKLFQEAKGDKGGTIDLIA